MTKKVILTAAAIIMLASAISINAQDVLLDEGFEGSWLPSGWTVVNGPVPYYWTHWTRGNYGSNYRIGTYSAYVPYLGNMSTYGISDDYLITPPIDLSGYGTVLFGFNSAFNVSSSSYYHERLHYLIKVSTDGGSSWDTPLADLQTDYTAGWHYIHDAPNPFAFDLSAYAGQTINIAFHAWWDPPSGSGWYYYSRPWYVDSVWVTGTTGGGGGDLAMQRIIRPEAVEEGGVAFKPKCTIYNPSGGVVNAEIRCRIKDMSNQQTVHEEVLGTYPVDPGYVDVTFDRDCELEGDKMFEALFVVTAEGDPNEQNNDKTIQVSTEPGLVVTPIAMLSPAETQHSLFSPKATFKAGGAEVTNATLNCLIEGMGYQDPVYEESIAGQSFAVDEEKDIEFPALTELDDGDYLITFWSTDEEGKDISGEPFSTIFTYEFEGIAENPAIEVLDFYVKDSKVNFTVGTSTRVNIRVYDAAGNLMSVLASGNYGTGSHELTFNPPASGVYFFTLTTPSWTAQEKAIVLK